MGTDKYKSATAGFRRQAEATLKVAATEAGFMPSDNKTRQLLHELQVHQLELKLQNAELCRARDEMESVLEKYTDLYDFAPVGYLSLDSEGTILGANLTVAGYLGQERSLLLGRRFGMFVADESRRILADFLRGVFKQKSNNSCELKLFAAGNSPRYVQLDAKVVEAQQECRIAVIDITGRKRAEEEIRRVRDRLAWVLERTSVGIWLNELPLGQLNWDEQTRRLFFIEPDAVPTVDLFWSRIHPDDRDRTMLAVEKALSEHSLYEIDHRVVNPASGEIRWIHSVGQAIYAADGTPTLFDGINYDITESKQAEEKLQQAHDELDVKVRERTSELTMANMLLLQEIAEHKRSEELLLRANEEMKGLKARLQAENIYLQQEIAEEHNFGDFIGQSKVLSQVFLRINQVAPMNATVLLLGETGTGKGVVARAIHSRSVRKDRPMVTVNCSSLPANLIESELFGREKGAFTGADAKQIGRFELAHGGTIFLDEIGELPLELQSKLLRVIQDGEFERLGSPHTVKVDVRFIVATNRKLEEEVKNGRFREDLFYRINIFPITLPPLRQRREDIPLLVSHFVAKFNKKNGKAIETVASGTLKMLQEYSWPGNVRELENVIERAVIISPGAVLQVLDRLETSRNTGVEEGEEIKAIAELEHDYILKALLKTGWRVNGEKGAALLLGLNPSTLRARMKKLGISRQ